ncbi:lipid IV(A) palmitoyltransferase PagP [Providencia heimbachae]|uniref:Lipid A acyltransferase PagP n=1 Tax=Providencia heimbachae ATCC 35613 TaxID=1354272 RepID=A0A1B7K3Z9_9GAMM|nr:lipid IV(A) palmitoyltransferase PagP [Providencia heimbachae]OAT54877.1 lipid A palmitoyltransferase [Providencia heimbachae ATCC 35613]SQH13063.1 Lipid A palmitoyltransferase PagP precursor [Providencia heimbachae]
MRVKKNRQLIASSTLLIAASIGLSSPALAEEKSVGLWDKFTNNVSTTWDSDKYELYIPTFTWHNRFTYDKEKTDSYNEQPWGIGFGKYRFDEDNDWHSLYAMVFKDSHNKFEPIVGYGFQKMWVPGDLDGFRMGAGFTLSITARDDYNYIPIPVPLPLVSIEYDRLSLQATYIPGTYNNGNVLFAWLRWQW